MDLSQQNCRLRISITVVSTADYCIPFRINSPRRLAVRQLTLQHLSIGSNSRACTDDQHPDSKARKRTLNCKTSPDGEWNLQGNLSCKARQMTFRQRAACRSNRPPCAVRDLQYPTAIGQSEGLRSGLCVIRAYTATLPAVTAQRQRTRFRHPLAPGSAQSISNSRFAPMRAVFPLGS